MPKMIISASIHLRKACLGSKIWRFKVRESIYVGFICTWLLIETWGLFPRRPLAGSGGGSSGQKKINGC